MGYNYHRVRYFLLVSFIFIIGGLILCLDNAKIALHLKIIAYHSHFWDIFFKNITYIGDGAFALILLPYLVFYTRIQTFLLSFATCFIAGIYAQFFKKVIFTAAYRPSKLIPLDQLHQVSGIHLHSSHAFPSGHTTSAFAFFILLSFLFAKNKIAQVLLAFIAILVGLSRVYLSQHFLGDVLFGSSLGILAFMSAYALVVRLEYNFMNKTIAELIFPQHPSIARIKVRM